MPRLSSQSFDMMLEAAFKLVCFGLHIVWLA